MSDQFNFEAPESAKTSREIERDELLAKYTEEELATLYKDRIGQYPKAGMSDESIAEGILDFEEERARVRAENYADDKRETTRIYRR